MSQTIQHLIAEYIRNSGKMKAEIAAEIGVSPSTITRWSKGELKSLTRENANKIAKFLNMDPNKILDSIDKEISGRIYDELSGDYSLYQWSFLNTNKIIRTNIKIKVRSHDKRNNVPNYIYEETFLRSNSSGQESISIMYGNIKVHGHTLIFQGENINDKYKYGETECMVFKREHISGIFTGIVLGYSSASFFPSASKVCFYKTGSYIGPCSSVDYTNDHKKVRLIDKNVPIAVGDYLSSIDNSSPGLIRSAILY